MLHGGDDILDGAVFGDFDFEQMRVDPVLGNDGGDALDKIFAIERARRNIRWAPFVCRIRTSCEYTSRRAR